MLELKNIKKDYETSTETVNALKGISIKFRENEFVAILGQSGCGKTTLLNIIGGLDHYTSGDLIINGKSTKEFKDRDWDVYRNHSIGFVFQSYNLIPHQSILANVELALTISGVSRKERKQRAIDALEKVGLGDKIHKRPNELSGGQMQRVAIARAIVNNPDIILADEPTGALDTKTSRQVMDILKEISKEHLVIMVTHNPDLAEKYATRIVKILDGNITDDSNPYEGYNENKSNNKKKKPSMSFFTALSLSLNNLLTKKGRTILTAFAGSIGIIGIALILSLSTGVQNYISSIEEDTLASYPITIENSTIDFARMMTNLMGSQETERQNKDSNKIYSRDIMDSMLSVLSSEVKTNNLTKFKEYIENTENIKQYANAIQYSYDIDLNLYKSDTTNGVIRVNPSNVMSTIEMDSMMETKSSMIGTSSMMMGNVNVFSELFNNEEMLENQYEIVAGNWPQKYNEVVLITDKNNEISDYTLYSLGIKDQKELEDKMNKIKNGEEISKTEESSYSYDEFLNLSFKLLLNSDLYEKENGVWIDKSENEDYLKEKLKNAEEIKIVGIVKQKDGSVSNNTEGGVGYTKELTEYVVNKENEAKIVKEQKENKDINVFTGLEFPTDDEKKDFSLDSLSQEQRMKLASMNAEDLSKLMDAYVYNNIQENENDEINYTDTVGIMMSSVSTIVDTISYVLIAFVAISLIVSSIMIGIITYISVLERTKEIGILRAIGASKKDISRVFNAETFITGLISGLLGIGVTILLTIPINSIIQSITGVNVAAVLPWQAGIILVLISMFLTITAGLIPSKMASKRDPVKALRTE